MEPIGDPDSLSDLRLAPRYCTSSEEKINKREGGRWQWTRERRTDDNGGDVEHPMADGSGRHCPQAAATIVGLDLATRPSTALGFTAAWFGLERGRWAWRCWLTRSLLFQIEALVEARTLGDVASLGVGLRRRGRRHGDRPQKSKRKQNDPVSCRLSFSLIPQNEPTCRWGWTQRKWCGATTAC
jgi:hypothetical protein